MTKHVPTFRPRHMLLRFAPQPGSRSPWVTAARHEFANGIFTVKIPANFRTDLASVPVWLLWFAGPNDNHQRAALFHDACYKYKPCRRSTADEVFRVIMLTDGVHPLRAWLLWAAVRLFGGRAWNRDGTGGLPALGVNVNGVVGAIALMIALCGPTHPALADGPPPAGLTVPCRVTEIIDGDTIEVAVTIRLRVRLLDCWAPEIRTADPDEKRRGTASREHLRKIAADRDGILHVPAAGARRLGDLSTLSRTLGHVWVDGDARSLSARQVAARHATKRKP